MRARSAGGLPTSQRGHDGRHRGGLVARASRLWPTSQPYGSEVPNYVGYLGNARQTPERKEAQELTGTEAYGGIEKSRFRGSGGPAAPPVETGGAHWRSNKLPRGQSYLFKSSQNPAVTGKPAGPALSVSAEQQGGSAEPLTPAPPTQATQDKYGAGSQESVPSGPAGGSWRPPKPAQAPKRLYGFRGFEHPTRSRAKANSGQPGSKKGRFRMPKQNPALLAKHGFSQRGPGLPGFEAPAPEGARLSTRSSGEPLEALPAFRGFFLGGSRPPAPPARLESFTYTDVLGIASFSSVGANLRSSRPAEGERSGGQPFPWAEQ